MSRYDHRGDLGFQVIADKEPFFPIHPVHDPHWPDKGPLPGENRNVVKPPPVCEVCGERHQKGKCPGPHEPEGQFFTDQPYPTSDKARVHMDPGSPGMTRGVSQ